MPRFTFEKFPEADETLTTSMKSVGEAMAIGRTFKEAFQKCIRSMEIKRPGYGLHPNDKWLDAQQRRILSPTTTVRSGSTPSATRHAAAGAGFRRRGAGRAAAPIGVSTRRSEWPIPDDVLVAEDRDALPGPAVLHPLRAQARLVGRADSRAVGHRPVVPRSARRTGRVRGAPAAHCAGGRRAAAPDAGAGRDLPAGQGLRLQRRPTAAHLAHRRRHARPDQGSSSTGPSSSWSTRCAAEFEAYTPYYYSTHERPLAQVVRSPAGGRGAAAAPCVARAGGVGRGGSQPRRHVGLPLSRARRRARAGRVARRRAAHHRPAEGRHPRRRAEPHRPGHRVRLLLRPRRLRGPRHGLSKP